MTARIPLAIVVAAVLAGPAPLEMHYARIPRAYWRDRMRMARAMELTPSPRTSSGTSTSRGPPRRWKG